MAFRRRFRRAGARRTFRRKWDMQEYRECERLLLVDAGQAPNCNTPVSFADLLLSNGTMAGGVLQSAGAGSGVLWGGSRGQIQYSTRVDFVFSEPPSTSSQPCNLGINMMTAIVKLPLAEDRLTPLYIPNLIQAKSQLSVVTATQSDTVESVLWRRQEHLRWAKFELCAGDDTTCWPIRSDSGGSVCGAVRPGDGDAWLHAVASSVGMYGRTQGLGSFRARVKRRLNEREGIFLIRNFSLGFPQPADPPFLVVLQSNAWIQFACRQLR